MSCQQRLLCKCARFQIERDLHKNCSVMHQHSSSSSGPRLAAAALLLQSFGSLLLNICKYKYANTQIHMLQQSKASKAAAAAKPNTCFFCCNPLHPWYCKFANTNTAIDKYRCTQIHMQQQSKAGQPAGCCTHLCCCNPLAILQIQIQLQIFCK